MRKPQPLGSSERYELSELPGPDAPPGMAGFLACDYAQSEYFPRRTRMASAFWTTLPAFRPVCSVPLAHALSRHTRFSIALAAAAV